MRSRPSARQSLPFSRMRSGRSEMENLRCSKYFYVLPEHQIEEISHGIVSGHTSVGYFTKEALAPSC